MRNTIYRRRFAAGAATLAIGCVLALGGCSNSSDQQRIAELEAQVENLQAQVNGGGAAEAPATDSAEADATTTPAPDTAATPAPATTAPQADTSVTANYGDIADFEARVAALETEFAGVSVSKDMNANYQTYLEMKRKADQLSNEMDMYDEQQEYAAKSGSIPYADYVQIETAIDQLDDRLDFAEDSMQYALGIYDD